jgi:hypothetical protein
MGSMCPTPTSVFIILFHLFAFPVGASTLASPVHVDRRRVGRRGRRGCAFLEGIPGGLWRL